MTATTTRVTLPDGCTGIDMADGTRYTPRPGQEHIEVNPAHAAAIKSSRWGQMGLLPGEAFTFGTRAGRLCAPCNRMWNAWTDTCHRCGQPTQETRQS